MYRYLILAFNYSQYVAFTQDEVFLAVKFDFGAGVLADR